MEMKVLLCSDLDRTILPNGSQVESLQARAVLRDVVSRPELTLAYVSGRHEQLIRHAITDYDIPAPDYAIGDVGTTIYKIEKDNWTALPEWTQEISGDWQGASHGDLTELFIDIDGITLQEDDKQNTFKLSYYTATDFHQGNLMPEMHNRLLNQGIKASIIWSIDEEKNVGLLDILPASATKLHAVEFLMKRLQFNPGNTVFAGDSGNDLPVITSGHLQSVLVKNAHPDVVNEAKSELGKIQSLDKLYIAQGNFLGMNGNYSSGVLEGLAHFVPETQDWM